MATYVEKIRTVEAVQFKNGFIMPDWFKEAVNKGWILMQPDEENGMVAVVNNDYSKHAVLGDYIVYDDFTKDIRIEKKDWFEYHYEELKKPEEFKGKLVPLT